jgi:ABC-2 type transport system permease protein
MTAAAHDLAVPSPTAAAVRRPPAAMRMLRHQLRYDVLALLRNRQARFFTLALPVGMLFLFVSIFGSGVVPIGPGIFANGTTYYVTAQVVFGVVDGAFMALAVTLVGQRELGVLKRRRATPEPAWVIIASRVVTSVGLAVAIAGELLLVGRLAYAMPLSPAAAASVLATVVVGAASCCCLGFAVSTWIGSDEAAMPAVTGATLPLFFVSGIFVPWGLIPSWLQRVALVTPVRHLAVAVQRPFDGDHPGGVAWSSLAVVLAWGVAGLAVAVRRFRWSPRSSG